MRSAARSPRNSWWSQAVQNRMVALVLVMIVVMPFVANPAESRLGGVAAFVLHTFALILGVSLVWRSSWDMSVDQVKTFFKTEPNTPLLLLMALLAVSWSFAPNKLYAGYEFMRWTAGVLLFYVVAYQFRQSKHLFLLVDTLLFLGITTSVLSLGQYALDPGSRGTMLFGNQQLLGSFLMILLPVAAVVALTEQAPSGQTSTRQLVAQFATIMIVGSMLVAHTRTAWLGSLVGMLVLAALMVMTSAKSSGLRSQKHKLVLPGVLATISLGFVLLIGMQNSSIVSRASSLSNLDEVSSWQQRMNLFRGAIAMIKERPLTGFGIGQFPLEQRKFTSVGAELSVNGLTGTRNSLAEQVHNVYLQTAAELGLPALILMAAVMVTFLIAAFRRVREMDAGIRRSLLIASMACMASFAVDGLASPSWQLGQVSMFFWLMLGIGVSCLRPWTRFSE